MGMRGGRLRERQLRNIPRFNFTLFHLIASFLLIFEKQLVTSPRVKMMSVFASGIEAVEALNFPIDRGAPLMDLPIAKNSCCHVGPSQFCSAERMMLLLMSHIS